MIFRLYSIQILLEENIDMQTILVTGGGGYVGSRLIPRLLEQQYCVRVLDWFIFDPHLFDSFQDNPNLELIRGDTRDSELVRRSLEGIDAVIHLAAISNDPSSDLNPQLTREVNLEAVLGLVDIAKQQGVKRFINASSASVYGIKEQENVTEELPLEPITLYAKYKAESEAYILEANSSEFTTVSIRPATLCGYAPKLRLDLTVNILTHHAVRNGKITVFGGEQKRPNLHIGDMINLYLLLLEIEPQKIAGKVFNAGFENHKVKEIALLVKTTLNTPVEIETIPSDDNRSYHISSDKIRRELGFYPKLGIVDAIIELRDAFVNQVIQNPDDIKYYNVRFMKEHKIM